MSDPVDFELMQDELESLEDQLAGERAAVKPDADRIHTLRLAIDGLADRIKRMVRNQ